jgi:hypothetical protein
MGRAMGGGRPTDNLIPMVDGIDSLDREECRCQKCRSGRTRPETELAPGVWIEEGTRIDDQAPVAGNGPRRRLENGTEDRALLRVISVSAPFSRANT